MCIQVIALDTGLMSTIVPALSEVAGLAPGVVVDNVIHSASAEWLGFGPAAELDALRITSSTF
jgi:hypothetical protein